MRRRAAGSKTERQLFHAKSKTEGQFFHMRCKVAGSALVENDRSGCLGTYRGQKLNQTWKFAASISYTDLRVGAKEKSERSYRAKND